MCPESWGDRSDCCMRARNKGKSVEDVNLGQMMATGLTALKQSCDSGHIGLNR